MSTTISSGLLTEDKQVYIGRGILNTILLTDPEATSVVIYDSASGASGNVLFAGSLTESGSSQYYETGPVRCENGIFVQVVSGSCIVYFGG